MSFWTPESEAKMYFESYSYIPIFTIPTTCALATFGAPAVTGGISSPGAAESVSPVNGMMSRISSALPHPEAIGDRRAERDLVVLQRKPARDHALGNLGDQPDRLGVDSFQERPRDPARAPTT